VFPPVVERKILTLNIILAKEKFELWKIIITLGTDEKM